MLPHTNDIEVGWNGDMYFRDSIRFYQILLLGRYTSSAFFCGGGVAVRGMLSGVCGRKGGADTVLRWKRRVCGVLSCLGPFS